MMLSSVNLWTRFISLPILVAVSACQPGSESDLSYVANSSHGLQYGRVSKVQVVLDSSFFSAPKLKPWTVERLVRDDGVLIHSFLRDFHDQPITQMGRSFFDQSVKKLEGNTFQLSYSMEYSVESEPIRKSILLFKELSEEVALKLLQAAPGCFVKSQQLLENRQGSTADRPWKWGSVFSKFYPKLDTCTSAEKARLKEFFQEYPVTVTKSVPINKSVRPDTDRLSTDGVLSFLFLVAGEEVHEAVPQEIRDFGGPPGSDAQWSSESYEYPEGNNEGSAVITPLSRPVVDGGNQSTGNFTTPEGLNLVEQVHVDDVFNETTSFLQRKLRVSGKRNDGGNEVVFEAPNFLGGKTTVQATVRRFDESHSGKKKMLEDKIRNYDVFVYNGHAGMGDNIVFDAVESFSKTKGDYRIVALNACSSSTYANLSNGDERPQAFDFIAHSGEILFGAMPVVNELLFDAVLQKQTYFHFLQKLEKTLQTTTSGRLGRVKRSAQERGTTLGDLIPGTVVYERAQ